MSHILDILEEKRGPPLFSFEYFPPKTDKGVLNLFKRAWRMQKQNPLFMDITWGAGGSTSDLTMKLATNMTKLLNCQVNMHLTCTNIKAETVAQALEDAKANGINNILALRGDPPEGQEKWAATEGGFECALDLIKFIKEKHGDYFGISTAGYPEGHPNAIKKVEDVSKLTASETSRLVYVKDEAWVCYDADYDQELVYLKKKVDAGASLIVTQLFYDADVFLSFVYRCRAMGIMVPILPGIMPIASRGGFTRMIGFCKTRIPADVQSKLDAAPDDEAFAKAGHEIVLGICKKVWASGAVPALHFYTLNKDKEVYVLMKDLGIDVIDAEAAFPEEKEEIYKKLIELVPEQTPA
jgi:methylenetetrahydrofolate reductase (NADPH)